MTISDAQFAAWLLQDRERVVLVDMDYIFEGSDRYNTLGSTIPNASSVYISGTPGQYSASKATDGNLIGFVGGQQSYWNSAPAGTFPQYWWTFAVGTDAIVGINKVIVYSLADDYTTRSTPPSDGETGTLYCLTDFEIQIGYGSLIFPAWDTVAHITGNNLLKSIVTFPARSNSGFDLGLRIKINDAQNGTGNPADYFARIVEVEAYKAVPTRSTIYLSNRPYHTEATDTTSNTSYRAVIKQTPQFTRSIDRQTLGGRIAQSIGEITINNADGESSFLLDLLLDGQEARVSVGDPSWRRSDFRQIFSSIVERAHAPSPDRIVITLHDRNVLVDSGIVGPTIGSGPNAGKPAPIVLGSWDNVGLTLIDGTINKYWSSCMMYTAGTSGVVIAYDNGVSVPFTDNHDGTITLTSTPAGVVTAKFINPSPYLSADPAILHASDSFKWTFYTALSQQGIAATPYYQGAHVSYFRGYPVFAGGTWYPFDNGDTWLGIAIRQRINAADLLDQIAFSSNSFWGFTRDGKFTFGKIRTIGTQRDGDTTFVPVDTFSDDDVVGRAVDTDRLKPLYKAVTVRYGRYDPPLTYVAGSVPQATATDFRNEWATWKTTSGATFVGNGLASAPWNYSASLVDSPELETLIQPRGNVSTGPNSSAAQWAIYYLNKFLPHIEFRSFTTMLHHYALELGDLVNVYQPKTAGDTASAIWQVLSVAIDPAANQVALVLVRRRVPQWAQVIEGASAPVTDPTLGHGAIYATQLLSGNRVFDPQRI